ncbi:uncharacterized protein LOC115227578 [Octopus sinensis]|uniref:Uncharacterized protein LOC115227578 n=2 Tax=Octopus sinensis TaxID=2607531 RepID=A0A6P7TPV1_9MOLL|nr:uncharacterized protein LOC115227578 [Octopus sinensis]
MVKLDVSNAFNSIRRDHLLECCRELVPFAYPLVHLSYASPSILMFDDVPISSATGVQQGDPLGPVLFALGVNSIAHSVRSPVNIWYLDDATICGPPDAVFDDLRSILPSLSDIGLSINANKSEIVNIALNPSDFTASISTCRGILSDVRITDKSNLTILGAPMGPSALECSLAGKISHLSKMIDKLKVIEPHVAFFLLRNHFSVPKILYTLRCAPCFQRGDLLSDLDNILRLGTSSLCNLAFDDPGWTQASLPVRWGGLGLRSYSDLALPAFLSAHHASRTLSDIVLRNLPERKLSEVYSAARGRWEARFGSKLPNSQSVQRQWDEISCQAIFEGLLPVSNQHRVACLRAGRCESSGVWLKALPLPSIGNLLDKECLRIAISLRVG